MNNTKLMLVSFVICSFVVDLERKERDDNIEVGWITTKYVLADALTKGKVPRTALLQALWTGTWTIHHKDSLKVFPTVRPAKQSRFYYPTEAMTIRKTVSIAFGSSRAPPPGSSHQTRKHPCAMRWLSTKFARPRNLWPYFEPNSHSSF